MFFFCPREKIIIKRFERSPLLAFSPSPFISYSCPIYAVIFAYTVVVSLGPPIFVCLYSVSWFLFSSDHEDFYSKMCSSCVRGDHNIDYYVAYFIMAYTDLKHKF